MLPRRQRICGHGWMHHDTHSHLAEFQWPAHKSLVWPETQEPSWWNYVDIYEYDLNWIANSLCPISVCKFDWEDANLEGTVKYWPSRGSEYRASTGRLKSRMSSDIIAPVCRTRARAWHFTSVSWRVLSEHDGCLGPFGTSFASYNLRNAFMSSS